MKRQIGSVKSPQRRKNSLNEPIVSLDKYKTDRVVDQSLAKEKEVTWENKDKSRFYDYSLKPTTPSYSFRRLNPMHMIVNNLIMGNTMKSNKNIKSSELKLQETPNIRYWDIEKLSRLLFNRIGSPKSDAFNTLIDLAPDLQVFEDASSPVV